MIVTGVNEVLNTASPGFAFLFNMGNAVQQARGAARGGPRTVEALKKLLDAPVTQTRSALRRLGVQVTLELEPTVEPWITNAALSVSGTFAGLAEGWLLYGPPNEEAAAPSKAGQSCCAQDGAGMGNGSPTPLRAPDFESSNPEGSSAFNRGNLRNPLGYRTWITLLKADSTRWDSIGPGKGFMVKRGFNGTARWLGHLTT